MNKTKKMMRKTKKRQTVWLHEMLGWSGKMEPWFHTQMYRTKEEADNAIQDMAFRRDLVSVEYERRK